MKQSRHLPRKYVWTFCWSRHSTYFHWQIFACYKKLLDRKSYCPQIFVHLPPEGWDQGQRQQIIIWLPQIWLFGLPRHSWQSYALTKESRGHSISHSFQNLQTIASVYQYDLLIPWQLEKLLWASRPITSLTSKNVKYDWKDEQQKCFDAIKRVLGREVLLDYPDFNALFEIYTDASKIQISAFISQKRNVIALY